MMKEPITTEPKVEELATDVEMLDDAISAKTNNAENSAEVDNKVTGNSKSPVLSRQKRWSVIACRILIGAVFIFSGFVKAIDPWGGLYKFQEYFLALNLDSLIGVSLLATFALSLIELMTGISLLIGAYRRSAPIAALLLMVIMLPLTLYLAVTDAVPDCGCFGDAITLSNWATFLKNIAIIIALTFLLKYNNKVKGIYGPAVQWVVLLLTFVFGMIIALTGYFYQPLIDFRPFNVGTKLNIAEGYGTNDDDYIFIYSKDGKEHEFSINNLPDEEDGWEFVDRRATKPAPTPAQQASVQPISIYDEGIDVTSEVLSNDRRQLLFLFPDIANVSISYTFQINELNDYASIQDVDVIGLSSGTRQQIEEWNDISLAEYPVYMTDDTDIKIIARGNPAVVFIDHGVIKWKRTLASINPQLIDKENITIDKLSNDFNPKNLLWRIITYYLLSMLLLLVINRFMPIYKHFRHKKAKTQ